MKGSNSRALVLGGTGAMGIALVNILADNGIRVFVTSRKEHIDQRENVTYIKGNAKDTIFLSELLKRRWDCIVDFMVYSTNEFRNRADRFLSATNQYIFISSARVYAESDKPLTEKSPRLLDVCMDQEYLKTDEYALSKARQEDILMSAHSKNFTIVRPSLTYNSNRLQFAISEKEEWLYRALHGRSIILPDDMMHVKTTMTYGGDVAYAISKLVGNKKALGETVHITNSISNTWEEIWKIYQSVFEEKTGEKMKLFIANDSLKIASDLGRTYQIKYARRVSRTFSNEKMNSIIGETSFLSAEDGLKKCLGEFLDGAKKIGPVNERTQAYFDRLTGEHADLSEFKGVKGKLKYMIGRHIPFLNK